MTDEHKPRVWVVDYSAPPGERVRLCVPLTWDEGRAVTVYRARLAGEVRGVAFNWVSEAGYGGPITLTVGIGRDGRIASVRVLSHSETPGLGD